MRKQKAASYLKANIAIIVRCLGYELMARNKDSVLKNYECEGQIDIFEYLEQLNKVCSFSGHTCNKKNLWEVADSLDELQCPHVCCRRCNTRHCGARCNGSEEPKEKIYPVDIMGLCDDAYCPVCGSGLDEYRHLDCERCPECHVRISWEPWYRRNSKCMIELFGDNWVERIKNRINKA